MGRPAQNTVRILHPEQETSLKKPWERMDGEPPRWFLHFTRYRLMGRQRSLQACFEQEQMHDAVSAGIKQTTRKRAYPLDTLPKPPGASDEVTPAGTSLTAVKPVLPGSWRRACVKWDWVARAEAWDVEQWQEWQAKLTKDVYLECEFASRSYRVWTLNSYSDFLQRIITQTFDHDPNVSMKDKLDAIKLSREVMKDIRAEMDKLEDPFRSSR